MPDISLTRPADWSALGDRWRALEAAADGSFFRSWSWVGCLAEARYPDPVLVAVKEGAATLALGLFNRQRRVPGRAGRLWLNASGRAAMDRVFVEHNGLLLARAAPAELAGAVLGWLVARGHRVVLRGVDAAHAAAAAGVEGAVVRPMAHPAAAPFVDLDAVRRAPGGHLGLVSANARQQIRASLRRYGAVGPVRVARAASLEEARAHLAALAVLHQRTWTGRGRHGAFADPEFVAFHDALMARAWPRGEIDLLRVAAGERTLGYLYNFRWRGRVANYQSGFDYDAADSARQKPGLTSHHLAVEMYAAEGAAAYDMLAGQDRYKTTLATGAETLHWIELLPRASVAGVLFRLRQRLPG